MTPQIVAVDHFAGVGWGVACRALGIREYGADTASSVIRTRSANGMRTIYRDVWAGLFYPWLVPAHRLYIASPPCQTFSMAGNGEGRAALLDVLQAIADRRYESAASLHALTETLDPRTALVLTPLAHIYQHRPELVALEQVPEVLPIWHAIGGVLRTLGYSVWTGILSAEMYGVPQTRRRAILMARLDGVAEPPVPTHSRYYSLEPQRLDAGVLPWISMAEALGWDPDLPVEAHAVRGKGLVSRYGDRPGRSLSEPAFTLRANGGGNASPGFVWRRRGNYIETNQDSQLGGGRKKRYSRNVDAPSPTLTGQARSWKWADAPATTVTADPRITAREHHNHGEQNATSLKLTVFEAAALQTFPEEFVWRGSKTKQFLQIGNAVPPRLAVAILGALIAPPRQRNAWESVFAEVAVDAGLERTPLCRTGMDPFSLVELSSSRSA